MEFTKHASGVAKGGLTTGIIGTSLGALALLGTGANGLGNILGGRNAGVGTGQAYLDGVMMAALMNGNCGHGYNYGGCCDHTGECSHNHFVTRYDAEKDARIAQLESQIALRDSNTYTDQKALEMYRYVDGRLRDIENQLCQQAVINQATSDKIQLAAQEAQCCCDKTNMRIDQEAERRCCGDNAIVNYVNSTFYPQNIANITTGTTTTQETRYNPLSNCGCDCHGGKR